MGFRYGSVDALESIVDGYVADDFEKRAESSVFSFPGGTVSGFHDAIESALRGAYLFGNVRNCLSAGQPTWASLEAYHCSLVFCRAVLGFLGIGFVRIKDTNCVIDLFPAGASKDTQRRFRRIFGTYESPARLFFRKRGSLIEQSGMWALFVRTLRVATLPASLERTKNVILNLDGGFGRSRNDILYRNQSWPFSPDLQWPLSMLDINDNIFSYTDRTEFFSANRDANFCFCKLMIDLTITLMNDVVEGAANILLPSYYGSAITKFTSFAEKRI